MLARRSDACKYYLPKVRVFTYLNDVCIPKLVFAHVRSSKSYEISLLGPNSNIIRVNIGIGMKN